MMVAVKRFRFTELYIANFYLGWLLQHIDVWNAVF